MGKIKLGVIVGRFQPLHDGHKEIIRKALDLCDNLLILIGSANRPRSIKNPWTYKERRKMVSDFVESIPDCKCPIAIQPLNDYLYSDTQWIADVTEVVKTYSPNHDFVEREVTLFGFDKDGNDYLKWFPQYSFMNIKSNYLRCATEIRQEMFESRHPRVPAEVMLDYDYFKNESDRFSAYPF